MLISQEQNDKHPSSLKIVLSAQVIKNSSDVGDFGLVAPICLLKLQKITANTAQAGIWCG